MHDIRFKNITGRTENSARICGTAASPIRRVRLADWTSGVHWSGDATGRYAFLLSKYGRPAGEMERRSFSLRRNPAMAAAKSGLKMSTLSK